MNRRTFVGAVAALVTAPLAPKTVTSVPVTYTDVQSLYVKNGIVVKIDGRVVAEAVLKHLPNALDIRGLS